MKHARDVQNVIDLNTIRCRTVYNIVGNHVRVFLTWQTPARSSNIPPSSSTVWTATVSGMRWYYDVIHVIFTSPFVIAGWKYIHSIQRHLPRSLNMLSHWADSNGFKSSSSKTACIHFYRLRSAYPNPELMLNGTLIPSTHSLPQRSVCEGAKPSACCCSHLLGSRAADLLTSL